MSLEEIFKNIPKPKKRQLIKSLKKIRKFSLRAAKFSRRKGCYVVITNNVKCLDCGLENFGHRLGCTECSKDLKKIIKGVVYGAFLNTGKIGKDRTKPVISEHEFITYKDLHKRIVAGERFYDIGLEAELTVKHFK